jgi:hypothetical protein
MSIFGRELQPRTSVQFLRSDGAATFPISLGSGDATVSVDGHVVGIPAGQARVIRWPEGCDMWELDGRPQGRPQFWRAV